jgi:hypothetical protein
MAAMERYVEDRAGETAAPEGVGLVKQEKLDW